MNDRIKARLAELKAEFARGEEQLKLLEQRKAELQSTLQRIQGAIQVLQELAAETEPTGNP